MKRRDFLNASLAGVVHLRERTPSFEDRLCLFTDHLAGFEYTEVARMLKQLGVTGPDLTVRPGGLVLPERVTEDLPKAARGFQEHGLHIPMITTGITSRSDPAAGPTLTSAAKLGIRYYKLGYYRYEDLRDWRSKLESTCRDLEGLIEVGRTLEIQAGFHNPSGPFVGGALWDSCEILSPLDPQWVGFYFDPAQATIEGGKSAWSLGFHPISERLKMVAIKDFAWEKVKGEWRTRWVPLGQGDGPMARILQDA